MVRPIERLEMLRRTNSWRCCVHLYGATLRRSPALCARLAMREHGHPVR
jgi:hypothetical protein